ncbi:MAG: hypothetical protein WC099_03580 [Candidatus Paceibacterota bacterium]
MKEELIQKLIQQLSHSITELDTYIASTQEEAIQAPGAMQSQHDTTKREAGYRMNELVERRAYLTQSMKTIVEYISHIPHTQTHITLGSYVTTQDIQDNKKNYFILPAGEGEIIEKEDISHHIFILSPRSPLFSLLEGKTLGATYVFRDILFTIVDIQ